MLLTAAAREGDLPERLVVRDYWMCQIATSLMVKSKIYPGSYTSLGGGSLLSLAGITRRLSEDVDITVSFVDGADACSSHKSKRLMEECQASVKSALGIDGTRSGTGGGNYFRSVFYTPPSVLGEPDGETQVVRSDMGLRDAPKEHLVEFDGMPYMGRVAQRQRRPLPPDLASRRILGISPMQVLADKLDAVCWRESLVPVEGSKALDRLRQRIRDHYDICQLIRWLHERDSLTRELLLAAVERSKVQEQTLRMRAGIHTRPHVDRPSEGFHTLRAWSAGTREHEALASEYPRLRSVVFGELPSFADVCDTVHSAARCL